MKSTFIRYFIIGFLTVTIDFSLMKILSSNGLDLVYSNIISVLVSIIFNFLMQNYWSFKAGPSNTLIKSIKYITLTTFNYFVNTYGFFVLYRTFEFENLVYTKMPIFSQILPEGFVVKIIITGLIMSWNFLLFKYWVFKVKKNPQNEQ